MVSSMQCNYSRLTTWLALVLKQKAVEWLPESMDTGNYGDKDYSSTTTRKEDTSSAESHFIQ